MKNGSLTEEMLEVVDIVREYRKRISDHTWQETGKQKQQTNTETV